MILNLAGCATQESRVPERPGEFSFETEWSRSGDDSRSGSAGHAWERTINSTLEQGLNDVFEYCAAEEKQDARAQSWQLRFVLDVAGDGSVHQTWSDTQSPFPTCARERLRRVVFAPPPKDGQRLGIIIEMEPQ